MFKDLVEIFGYLAQEMMGTLYRELPMLLALVLTERKYTTGFSCWWVNKSGVHLDRGNGTKMHQEKFRASTR